MAIIVERAITVKNDKATLDRPIYFYLGDGDITCVFEIVELQNTAKFGQINRVNLITEETAYGQFRIYKPDGALVFSGRAEIVDDKLQGIISFEHMNNLAELGQHLLQIHLYDSTQRRNRLTIPPVSVNILYLVGYDSDLVDSGVVDKAVVGDGEEELPTFDADGNYNRSTWYASEIVDSKRLNKLEDAIDVVVDNISLLDEKKLDMMDLSEYATIEYVDNAIINKADATHTHNDYITTNEVSEMLVDGSYATVDDIDNKLVGLATEDAVDDKIAAATANLVSESDVDAKIAAAIAEIDTLVDNLNGEGI